MKFLGTLKGVTSKHKDTDNSEVHTVELKIELIEGVSRTQELINLLRQMVEVDVTSKQPTLHD